MTTIAAQPVLPFTDVTPGVYDIPADVYHGHKSSLSSSGARKLLPPSCPAKFKWDLDNKPVPKKVFEFGTAAHQMVLGGGPELVVVERPIWNTDAVKAEVKEIRARGAVPLKVAEYEQIKAMAKALREHPLAAALLDPAYGKPEQSLFWRDGRSGVDCRARPDWLPATDGGRMIVPDYKSAANASTSAFEKAVQDYRYDQQADFYSDGIRKLGLAEDIAFLFIVQEKTPPYLVNVVGLTVSWLLMGEDRNRRARETFKACTESGVWPGYSDDVEMAAPPAWLETQHEREYR